jgi:hypothetical protein
MEYKLSASDTTFLGLLLLMMSGKMLWIILKVDHPLVQQPLNSWSIYILVTVLGFAALKQAARTGFPDIWDIGISNKQRLSIPLLAGSGFGIINIIIAHTLQLNVPMVKFPYSIPVYFSVGILMEILFHLIPVVILLWFVSDLVLKKKRQNDVFWIFAVFLSLLEPVVQTIGMHQMGIISNTLFMAVLFIFIFAANMLPLYFFRMYGFLSAVVWRLSFYLIWHIIWGGFFY